MAGDTPLVMIGSELGYNAGQLGNDWEDDAVVARINGGITVAGFTPNVSGSIALIRNYKKRKTYLVIDVKGDVNIETKFVGAHLNVQGEYYPGVMRKEELDEHRESMQSPYLDKLLTKGLQVAMNTPLAKASAKILIGKGGIKTAGVRIQGGFDLSLKDAKFVKIVPFDIKKELTEGLRKNIETSIKSRTKLSNATKMKIKYRKVYEFGYNGILPPDPTKLLRGWE